MNLGVHSIMYTYYALCALGFTFSVLILSSITALQILQMMGALYIIFSFMAICPIHEERSARNMWLGLAMYTSYMVLFLQLFQRSYLKPRVAAPDASKDGIIFRSAHQD